jgi:putative ABC transport system substrate-binding protein
MRRREFVAGMLGALWPLTAGAQQRLPTIGLLSSVPFETRRDQLTGFHAGLKQLGFLEQQNVAVEYRSADNRLEQLPTLAAELAEHEVSVIVTIGGDIPMIAAKAATATIPIVFVTGNDPVKNRYVASLNRPGGNLTGISFLVNLTVSKRLELLCEVVPSARKIAMLANANNPNTPASIKTALSTAGMLGRGVLPISVATESQIAEAFHTLDQDKAEALVVEADPFLLARREQIVSLANYQRLPTMYSFREFAAIGGLMS